MLLRVGYSANWWTSLLSLVLLAVSCSTAQKPVQVEQANPQVLGPARALTFQGPRAGEGYFSADGNEMVFQSEREPGNPFYQIYLMNLTSGATRRISPGHGQTTCAWIHPKEDKVLFASTHLDPKVKEKTQQEFENRKKQIKEKYSWSYDENYDLFSASKTGGGLKRLTREKGYDAEGSYSPDGEWIAFASNRLGYTEKLSPEEEKLFRQDPSYMMDIYIMRADGSEVKRLTSARGYDGGPFFSSDGKKITWRRFSPDGHSAEIYTMNVDGSDQRPITKIGAMSWAPYFHPSGDYLIFTTNVLGYQNFELFIVDSRGQKSPVRVSYADGFDGLPVFTPDGHNLAWTHRNEKGESQIYMASWDDERARELLGLPKLPKSLEGPSKELAPQIRVSDVRAWVDYLAAPELGGRMSGSKEELVYTRALAERMSEWGLKPLRGDSLIHEFKFTSGTKIGPKTKLSIELASTSRPVLIGAQWQPLAISASGPVAGAEVAFVGYGIVAPASEAQAAYDSYKEVDVKGKWVMALAGIPENVSNARRFHLNIYAREHHKAMMARQRGAVGLMIVQPEGRTLSLGERDAAGGSSGLPVISVSRGWASELFTQGGISNWKSLEDKLAKGDQASAALKGVRLQGEVDLEAIQTTGRSVVGVLRVPGAKSSVLVGAHGDHLGHGDEAGNSLARGDEKGRVHPGADDNASGVTAILEIAHRLAHQQKTGAIQLKQNVIFAIWSGEELGVLGSSAFVRDGLARDVTAAINLDMVGRYRDNLMVQGIGSAKEWPGLFERWAAQSDLALTLQSDPYLPTDAMALYLGEKPSISFFTGSHAEYHTPRDKAELLNTKGIVEIAEFVGKVAQDLASTNVPLVRYQKVEGNRGEAGARGFRLYLGTIPDYAQDGVKGVKISGTGRSSPAEKAGLKAGDIIVELGENKIENIYDYVYCLQSMKANELTSMKVLREGRMVELKITPTLKE